MTTVAVDGTLISTSSVAPRTTAPVGRQAHAAAVERLQASYRTAAAALTPNGTIRLAKRTSNLFRPRAATAAPGLDVSGLGGVISIDAANRTADVQGMCTYETLVAATLAQGLMPTVVPQLRTITLGGAVTGLGIESSSFRAGLPHEAVRELDILTGAGEIVTATPDGPHAELFEAFPNSFGSLGYAVRLRVGLEPVRPYVRTRNVRFSSVPEAMAAIGRLVADRTHDGDPVDFLDGVLFAADEIYLVVGTWADAAGQGGAGQGGAPSGASDYTGERIYYRSLRERESDLLTVHDYLWRWDTDWFWCSKAFGAQHPAVRRWWPARLRRSDVYHRIVALENRYRLAATIDRRRGLPARERVVQDVEIPLGRTADFLGWYLDHVPMTPVWLCPLVARRSWPLYPITPGEVYVNVGFWGTVPIEPGRADGDLNRDVEAAVTEHGGHKSLYSDAYYDDATFWRLYGGDAYRAAKSRYDPSGRLADLYAKVVRRA